jgi:hypothetical protein
MASGIQSIVDTYVKLGRIDALTSLRAHRRKLLAEPPTGATSISPSPASTINEISPSSTRALTG